MGGHTGCFDLRKFLFWNMMIAWFEDTDMIKANPIADRLDQDQALGGAFGIVTKTPIVTADRLQLF